MTMKEMLKQAKQLGVCSMLTGNENTIELCDLLFTPQGVEFCTTNNFPSMEFFRSLESDVLVGKNVFIDAGNIKLSNLKRIFIAGNTSATLTYDDPSKRHEVIVMHGAKAVIKASNYAVVFVCNTDCDIVKIKDDTAEIL